ALIIPQKRLMRILQEIRRQLPWVTRVGAYANVKSIAMKTPEELEALRDEGLGIVYMGLETGDAVTLKNINKGATPERMIEMGKKIKAAGIKLSVTVILGIAGKKRSSIHAKATGTVLSAMEPDYVGALSLMLIPGTPLYEDYTAGRFELLSSREMLEELRVLLEHTDLSRGLFHANHASNYLPIKARLPRDKAATLALIDQALGGDVPLKPEWLRAL
ncbi:MAG: radical SAM protein, partial [Deltaproteobacteria bacterium]|nr:radical SAM protein [Deltaproteobacteria bacterium]